MKAGRIVILQDRLRPGGTERQSLWLTQTLQTETFSTELLLFQGPSHAPNDLSRATGTAKPLQNLPELFCWFAPGLIRRLRSLEADLVICMGRNANCHAAWIRRRMPEIRVVATVRTSRPLPFLYRRGIARADHCLTNSAWGARQLVEGGIQEAAHITTIPNALLRPELLDLDRSPAAVAAARATLGISATIPVLCNIASFVRGKNKQALLRAFHRCDPAGQMILLLAGDGPEEATCRQFARDLGLGDRVRFLGHIENVEPVLLASDLFVSTALRDALPNALVEAQAAGLPVIAFETGGANEAFIDGQSGLLVPSGDEEGFAAGIDALLRAPDQRRAFSATARATARKRFSPETMATRYRTFVSELLARP